MSRVGGLCRSHENGLKLLEYSKIKHTLIYTYSDIFFNEDENSHYYY